MAFNSDEGRYEHGRFTSGGSGGGSIPSHAELSGMKTITGPLGSQGGTWKQANDGTKYLVKPLIDKQHGMNEIAAGAVYHEAGIKFPNTGVVEGENGQHYLVSQKIEGLSQKSAGQWKSDPKLQADGAKGFGVDALLSHWDVHGLEADNTLVDKGGHAVRIESGGAMAYRATGGEKPSFGAGKAWVEPETMRTSDQGRALYGKMTNAQAADSLEAAGKINLDNVQARWDKMGVPRSMSDPWMATLKDRQQQIPDLVSSLRAAKKAVVFKTFGFGAPIVWRDFGKAYSEDEPRDEAGHWTSSGGGSAGQWMSEHVATTVTQNPVTGSIASSGLTNDQHTALEQYLGPEYAAINSDLRGGKVSAANPEDWTAHQVQSIIDKSTTDRSATVYRGIDTKAVVDRLKSMPVGGTFSDKGFVSTSLHADSARQFANGDRNPLLQINVPSGSHAIGIAGKESELLLGAGSTFRKDGEATVNGQTVLKFTYLGADPAGTGTLRKSLILRLPYPPRFIWGDDTLTYEDDLMFSTLKSVDPLGAFVESLAKEYNPDEPRNDKGEWTSGGNTPSSGKPGGGVPKMGDVTPELLASRLSDKAIMGASHKKGDRVFEVTYKDGTKIRMVAESFHHANAMGRQLGKQFMGGAKVASCAWCDPANGKPLPNGLSQQEKLQAAGLQIGGTASFSEFNAYQEGATKPEGASTEPTGGKPEGASTEPIGGKPEGAQEPNPVDKTLMEHMSNKALVAAQAPGSGQKVFTGKIEGFDYPIRIAAQNKSDANYMMGLLSEKYFNNGKVSTLYPSNASKQSLGLRYQLKQKGLNINGNPNAVPAGNSASGGTSTDTSTQSTSEYTKPSEVTNDLLAGRMSDATLQAAKNGANGLQVYASTVGYFKHPLYIAASSANEANLMLGVLGQKYLGGKTPADAVPALTHTVNGDSTKEHLASQGLQIYGYPKGSDFSDTPAPKVSESEKKQQEHAAHIASMPPVSIEGGKIASWQTSSTSQSHSQVDKDKTTAYQWQAQHCSGVIVSSYGSSYENKEKGNFTSDERAAVVKYTGSWYDTVNGKLRSGGKITDNNQTMNTARELQNAIDKSTIDQPVTVFRGSKDDFAQIVKSLQPGEIFRDSGFVSTSMRYETAKGFSGGGSGVVVAISMPEKSRALTAAGSETEMILSARSQFRLDGTSTINGNMVYNVTYLGADPTDSGIIRKGARVRGGKSDKFVWGADDIEIITPSTELDKALVILGRFVDNLAKGFNPDEPRGPDGRWGSGGTAEDKFVYPKGSDFSDQHLLDATSPHAISSATHEKGNRVFQITYKDGQSVKIVAESYHHANAMGRQYGKRFLGGATVGGCTWLDPSKGPIDGTTKPEPAPKPEPEQKPEPKVEGSKIPDQLQRTYDEHQARYDAVMSKTEGMKTRISELQEQQYTGSPEERAAVKAEIESLRGQVKEAGKEGLAISRSLGAAVTDHVEQVYNSTKPAGEAPSTKEATAAYEAAVGAAKEANMGERYTQMVKEIGTQRAAAAAPVIQRALIEGGVAPEVAARVTVENAGRPFQFGLQNSTSMGLSLATPSFQSNDRISMTEQGFSIGEYPSTRINVSDMSPETKAALAGVGLLQGDKLDVTTNAALMNETTGQWNSVIGRYRGPSPSELPSNEQAISTLVANGISHDVATSFVNDSATHRDACVSTRTALDGAKTAVNEYNQAAQVAYHDALWGTIGAMRPLGGELQTGSFSVQGFGKTAQGKADAAAFKAAVMGDVTAHLPSDWINRTNSTKSSPNIEFRSKGGGGYYQEHGDKLVVKGVGPSSLRETQSITLHEFGHRMQNTIPGLSTVENAFLNDRCPNGLMKSLGAGSGKGDPDNFTRAYTGRRDYGGNFTEVVTTGLQGMKETPVSTASSWSNTLKGDPDFQHMMTGVLLLVGKGSQG